MHYKRHFLNDSSSVRDALIKLNDLASDAIVFIVDKQDHLLGSLTDGDLRRGFIKGLDFSNELLEFVQQNPKFIRKGSSLEQIIELRKGNYKILPIIDDLGRIINIINFRHQKSYLPIDAVIMAGGRGERMKPLTDTIPKPLLKVGDRPIMEINIDRLCEYGVDNIWISINYLGNYIEDYFQNGTSKSIRINYIREKKALGTIGSLSIAKGLTHDDILIMNSDILTNINFEDFYLFFKDTNADFAIACIPYNVNIPYAVMETSENWVTGFKEKPTYIHYSNGGIYLMKRHLVNQIPTSKFYNATDLMDSLIKQGLKVAAYPFMGYWLDIGQHDDFKRAQEDIKQLNI